MLKINHFLNLSVVLLANFLTAQSIQAGQATGLKEFPGLGINSAKFLPAAYANWLSPLNFNYDCSFQDRKRKNIRKTEKKGTWTSPSPSLIWSDPPINTKQTSVRDSPLPARYTSE